MNGAPTSPARKNRLVMITWISYRGDVGVCFAKTLPDELGEWILHAAPDFVEHSWEGMLAHAQNKGDVLPYLGCRAPGHTCVATYAEGSTLCDEDGPLVPRDTRQTL